MVGKVGVGASNGFAGVYVLGFEGVSIGSQDEFCLRSRRCGAGFERCQRAADSPNGSNRDVDI